MAGCRKWSEYDPKKDGGKVRIRDQERDERTKKETFCFIPLVREVSPPGERG